MFFCNPDKETKLNNVINESERKLSTHRRTLTHMFKSAQTVLDKHR